ncbi:MAG: lipocalin-like domain-containing protein [Sporichthyaceae bacterium]
MDLVGTWTLRSFEVVSADGTVARPFGAAPLGQLGYRADGTMSALLCAPDRPSFGTRAGSATDAQWAAAARHFVAYAGRWEGIGDVVRHHVEIASIPDWIGTTVERTVGELDGNLVLTVEPRDPAGRTQRLTWAPVRV